MSDLFRSKVRTFGPRLMSDVSIGTEDAAAFFGNFGQETGGFQFFFQLGKPEWSAGVSWAQWDRTRRDEFRAWSTATGIDPKSDEAAYGFLVHELTNTWEKRVLPAVRAAKGIEAKTETVMRLYERPGAPHLDRRISWARMALDELQGAARPHKPQEATMTVPASWMPAANMQRVHVHWTAGGHKVNDTDKRAYHILIEGDGKLVRGTPSIALNSAPLKPGYAAHTLNANTGAIGVSMCCMMGARENPFNAGPAPMTRTQWDAMVRAVADLCRRYGIPVGPRTVLTHAEVQTNLGVLQNGKWDITRLAFDPSVVGAAAVGNRLRTEVAGALAGSAVGKPTVPPPAKDAAEGGILAAILATLAAAGAFLLDNPLVLLALLVVIGAGVFMAWRWWSRRGTEPAPVSLISDPGLPPSAGEMDGLMPPEEVPPAVVPVTSYLDQAEAALSDPDVSGQMGLAAVEAELAKPPPAPTAARRRSPARKATGTKAKPKKRSAAKPAAKKRASK